MKYRKKNPKAIIAIFFSLFVLLSIRNNISSNTNKPKNDNFTESINTEDFTTFTDWCLNKHELVQSTENTIDKLLNEVDTTDCSLAEKRLLNLSYVVFYGENGESLDLRPFNSLTHFTSISISAGNISDITPLKSSKGLKRLDLGGNKISDIHTLQYLTNLEELKLGQNDIYDISPIAFLSQLEELILSGNNISDISSLENLNNLDKVYLNDNQIKDESCPVKPEKTCVFFLRN